MKEKLGSGRAKWLESDTLFFMAILPEIPDINASADVPYRIGMSGMVASVMARYESIGRLLVFV